jgi:hypothetical protein
VSLFRLVLTCLWTTSLGVFVVCLDAERVRMQSEQLRWERFRDKVQDLRHIAVYDYWRTFQRVVPQGSLTDYLRGRKAEAPSAVEWEDAR